MNLTFLNNNVLRDKEGGEGGVVTTPTTPPAQTSEAPEAPAIEGATLADENAITALLNSGDDSDLDVDVESTPAPLTAPVQREATVTAPVTTPTPVVEASAVQQPQPIIQQPVVQPTAPVIPPAPLTAPVAPPTATAPLTQEEMQQSYVAARKNAENVIATGHYKLDDATLTELDESPGVAIPKLLSRVYMDAVTGAVSHMVMHLPQMMQAVLEGQETATKAEKQFFEKWPQLKGQEQTVMALGRAFRGANPQATTDDFVKFVGAQAVVALGLATQQQPQTQPLTSPQQNQPFRPAGVGGTMGAPRATQPTNPFEALAMESEDLDLD